MKLNIKNEISDEILALKDEIRAHFAKHCNVNDFLEILKFTLHKKEWNSFDPFTTQNGNFYSYLVDEAYNLSQGQDVDTQEVFQAVKTFMKLTGSEARELERLDMDKIISAIFLAIINFKSNDRS